MICSLLYSSSINSEEGMFLCARFDQGQGVYTYSFAGVMLVEFSWDVLIFQDLRGNTFINIRLIQHIPPKKFGFFLCSTQIFTASQLLLFVFP